MKKFNQLPGEYDLQQISLISTRGETVDLSDVVKEINIFEDLFSNTITGEIVISDSNNLPLYLPIIGEEELLLKFSTFGSRDSAFLKLKIHNIRKRHFIKENTQGLVLEGVSPEFLKNSQLRISKSYIDQEPSKIIRDIFSHISESSTKSFRAKLNMSFIIPNWRPLDAIKWITNRATGFNDEANFIFYQTMSNTSFDSEYHFNSINNLMKINSGHLPLILKNISKLTNTISQGNRVQSFDITKNISQLENLITGMNGSTLQVYDIFNKNFTEKRINYKDHFKKFSHTEKNILGNNDEFIKNDSTYFFNSTSRNQYENSCRIDSDIKEWLQIRRSQLQQLNNIKIAIQMSGNTEMKVGDIINFDMPSTEAAGQKNKQSTELIDKHYSGKFIITAIRHILSNDIHNMILEITKDALKENILL